jgi:phenylacetic acid degradation operon negative regulatory protein
VRVSQSSNTLTARSVLLSVLLGTSPPRLPVRRLVRTTELFGIAEGTTRTALSRMTAAGEVTAEEGWYALADVRLLARQARQSASRRATTTPWADGAWAEAVVVANGRRPAAERAALRAALATARLAELREGVWLRPDNLGGRRALADQVAAARGRAARPTEPAEAAAGPAEAAAATASGVGAGPGGAGGGVADDVHWFLAAPDGDPAALAARLWPLRAWAEGARRLIVRMAELVAPLESGDPQPLADGFVLSADVLRHVQADPLLPAELLPDGWPGAHLRSDYDRYDAAYRAVLAEWLRSTD